MAEYMSPNGTCTRTSLPIISRSLAKLAKEVAYISEVHDKAVSALRMENESLAARLKGTRFADQSDTWEKSADASERMRLIDACSELDTPNGIGLGSDVRHFSNIPEEAALTLQDHLFHASVPSMRLMTGVTKSPQLAIADSQALKKGATYGGSEIIIFESDPLRTSAESGSQSTFRSNVQLSIDIKDSDISVPVSEEPYSVLSTSRGLLEDDSHVPAAHVLPAASSKTCLLGSPAKTHALNFTLPRFVVRQKLATSGEMQNFIDQGGNFLDDASRCSGIGTSSCGGIDLAEASCGAAKMSKSPSRVSGIPESKRPRRYCCQLPIPPTSAFKLVWECTGVVLLMYDMVVIPMQVFDMPPSMFMWVMSWFILVYWCTDLMLAFLSGYYTEDGVLVMELKTIAVHYFRSWLAPDLGIISVDLIGLAINVAVYGEGAFEFKAEEESSGSSLGIMRIGKALRVLRLIRLFRIMKLSQSNFMEILQEKIMSEFVFASANILKNMAILCFICHGCACIFYYIGTQNYGDPNWVTAYGFDTSRWLFCYLAAFHWALAQFANGEIIIEPQSIPERLLCLMVLMAAMMFFSAFLGIVGNIVQQLFHRGAKKREEQWLLRVYLKQIGISWDLKMRVKRYINVLLASGAKQVSKSDVQYINILSKPLQMELQTEQYLDHFTVHPFFSLLSERSFFVIRELCCSAVKEVCLSQDDTLFSAGEQMDIMYFVYRGSLTYTQSNLHNIGTPPAPKVGENQNTNQKLARSASPKRNLVCDQWFCEAALWTERWLTCGIMSADTDSDLVGLIGEDFFIALTKHHTNMYFPKEYGNAYVNGINASIEQYGVEGLTDVPGSYAEVECLLGLYGFESCPSTPVATEGGSTARITPKSLNPFAQVGRALRFTGIGQGETSSGKRKRRSRMTEAGNEEKASLAVPTSSSQASSSVS